MSTTQINIIICLAAAIGFLAGCFITAYRFAEKDEQEISE